MEFKKSPSQGRNDLWFLALLGIPFLVYLTRPKPLHKPLNGIKPQENPGEKTDTANGFLALPSQVPPSQRDSAQACRCCRYKTPWWKVILDILTFLAAGTAAGAAIYYASIANHTWLEMKNANQIAKDAVTTSQRPWIGISSPIAFDHLAVVPNTAKPNPGHHPIALQATINFTIQNYGNSPATHISEPTLGPYAVLLNGQPFPDTWQNTACNVSEIQSNSPAAMGPASAIMPKQPVAIHAGIAVPLDENKPQTALIVGCITYKDAIGGERIHHTRMLIDISYPPAGNSYYGGLESVDAD